MLTACSFVCHDGACWIFWVERRALPKQLDLASVVAPFCSPMPPNSQVFNKIAVGTVSCCNSHYLLEHWPCSFHITQGTAFDWRSVSPYSILSDFVFQVQMLLTDVTPEVLVNDPLIPLHAKNFQGGMCHSSSHNPSPYEPHVAQR